MQDEYGNLLSFCNDPLVLETTGDVELIGPSVISLQGGMAGTYVKTKGVAGQGTLRIKAVGLGPEEMAFTIKVSGKNEEV